MGNEPSENRYTGILKIERRYPYEKKIFGRNASDLFITLCRAYRMLRPVQVAITFDADGNVISVEILNTSDSNSNGQSTNANITYTATKTIDSDTTLKSDTIKSTGDDENAVLVENGAKAILNKMKITRKSSSSTGGDNSSFYGVGAAVLTTDGNTFVKNSTITTDAKGGAGVFAYGDGTAYVSNTTIKTSQDTSGGIHVAGGGKLYAYDDTVTTEGESSAAIRSDRGGGTLTAKNGGMFYTTNTQSTFVLDNVDITYADENDYFLKCTGNSNQRGWGQSGSNGANCTFTGISQEMEGNVIWDSISNLNFYMTEKSTLTGAFIDDESNAGNGGSGTANLYIDSGSKWVVTADSTLTNLYNAGTIVDSNGNTVTIKGTDGTVYVQGTSSVTVTVSSYSTTADLSGASSVDSWSDYEVAMPDDLK
jgi:hypothetical protein